MLTKMCLFHTPHLEEAAWGRRRGGARPAYRNLLPEVWGRFSVLRWPTLQFWLYHSAAMQPPGFLTLWVKTQILTQLCLPRSVAVGLVRWLRHAEDLEQRLTHYWLALEGLLKSFGRKDRRSDVSCVSLPCATTGQHTLLPASYENLRHNSAQMCEWRQRYSMLIFIECDPCDFSYCTLVHFIF